MTGTAEQLVLTLQAQDRTHYAIQANDVPAVSRLSVANRGTEELRNITVRLATEPSLSVPWSRTLDCVRPGEDLTLACPDFQLSYGALGRQTERSTVRIIATAEIAATRTEGDEPTAEAPPPTLLATTEQELVVCALNEWPGIRAFPEIIAAFVMPNHPTVKELTTQVQQTLLATTRDGSLSGYQSHSKQRVVQMVEAMYRTVQACNLNYIVPPASFEEEGQRIRLASEMLQYRNGTCIDFAALFASLVESAGLHPLIVFIEGHAFAGVWLVEDSYPSPVMWDYTALTKRGVSGTAEILLFETTGVRPNGATFEQAFTAGQAHLEDASKFVCAVDIERCRTAGVRPLPMDTDDPGLAPGGPEAPRSEDLSALAGRITVEEEQPAPQTPATRLDTWERNLLDLTFRNSLLNHKPTGRSIPLLAPVLREMEDAVAAGRDLRISPRPSDWDQTIRDPEAARARLGGDPLKALISAEFQAGRICGDLAAGDLAKRLTALYRQSRNFMEETGANNLFLTLGMLRFYQGERSEEPYRAPLILLPVHLIRTGRSGGYALRASEDDTQVNVTLLELLRRDFQIDIPGIDPPPSDNSGIDVDAVFRAVRSAIVNMERWEVEETAVLSTYSFSKFVMWKDLCSRKGSLRSSKIVESLLQGAATWKPDQELPAAQTLDTRFHPSEVLAPLSADSSQLAAICAAGAGHSFVLHGPPGTGKSQTIANIIVHSLAQGRSVLFVSEKMAALNVVYDRLKRLGVDPFCLELHSNKASRKQVLDQFRAPLDLAGAAPPAGWVDEANRLAALRTDLNRYVTALHAPRPGGFTVHQVIGRHTVAESAPAIGTFPAGLADRLTATGLRDQEETASLLSRAGAAVGHPAGHVWTGCGLRQADNPTVEAARARLSELADAIDKLAAALAQVWPLLGLEAIDANPAAMASASAASRILLDSHRPPAGLLVAGSWEDLQVLITEWVRHGKARDALRARSAPRYRDAALAIDTEALVSILATARPQWFMPRMLGERKVTGVLQRCAVPGVRILASDLDADLTMIAELAREEKVTAELGDQVRSQVAAMASETPDWPTIEATTEATRKLRKHAAELAGGDAEAAAALRACWSRLLEGLREAGSEESAAAKQLNGMLSAIPVWQDAWTRVKSALSLEVEPGGPPTDTAWLDRARAQAQAWTDALPRLREWVVWVRARSRALELGLAPLVTAYESGQLAHDQIQSALVRALLGQWLNETLAGEPVLAEFSRSEIEHTIERFRKLDSEFAQLSIRETLARLAARVPQQNAAVDGAELGLLRRQLGLTKPSKPTRALLHEIPNLRRVLKPCMLMSPISVAQYLEPTAQFDLVLFDEASQMPTAEAVGALARATEAIVVGDPQQLPPTTFFERSNSDEEMEDVSIPEVESILDDCIAIAMPNMHLQWHYRSRHEELIAFSNATYYDYRLLTFPSANDLERRVILHSVGGTYGRSKTRTNMQEAQAVVAQIVKQLTAPNRVRRSMGVVALNSQQQNLIQDLLDQEAANCPELDREMGTEVDEPIFVKNLENVQGDERDIILFSIGYGPDDAGKVTLNFGPLNLKGGHRRLNVAVSRARHEMHVFTSLTASQIQADRAQEIGPRHLRDFLAFAEKGRKSLPARTTSSPATESANLFEEQVRRALEARGHEVRSQVGCSGYRIDLAVVDPQAPGRFILGIECDGAQYHSARTARDRDKLRAEVLVGLGWTLHRVWSTDWWHDADHETDRIEAAIEEARRTPPPSPTIDTSAQPGAEAPLPGHFSDQGTTVAPMPAPVPEPVPVPSAIAPEPYSVHKLKPCTNLSYAFFEDGNRRAIADQMAEVIKAEAPISRRLLYRRIAFNWGKQKVNTNVEAHLDALASRMNVPTTESNGIRFFWSSPDQWAGYRRFRSVTNADGTVREAEDLPPQEYAAAAEALLRTNFGMPESVLVQQVARLFGYARTGAGITQAITPSISLLVVEGRAWRSPDGRINPPSEGAK